MPKRYKTPTVDQSLFSPAFKDGLQRHVQPTLSEAAGFQLNELDTSIKKPRPPFGGRDLV
jgi:hypothetical protein